MSQDATPASLDSARKALSEKRIQDAIGILKQISSETPDNPEVLSLLGAAYAEDREYPIALSYLSKSLSIKPSAKGHYNLAMLHRLMHDERQAKRSLQEALRLDPNYQRAKQMLAEFGEQDQQQAEAPQQTMIGSSPPQPMPPTQPMTPPQQQMPMPQPGTPPQGYAPPGQQYYNAPPPSQGPISQSEIVRNWPLVTLGGILVGIPFLFLWAMWTMSLAPMGGYIFGALISLVVLGLLIKWLSDNAGAYEIWHWIAMILLTGLLPSLIIIKGFDLLAKGWYGSRRI